MVRDILIPISFFTTYEDSYEPNATNKITSKKIPMITTCKAKSTLKHENHLTFSPSAPYLECIPRSWSSSYQSPLHSLTACCPCFIHQFLLTLSNQCSTPLLLRGTHALLTSILPLPLHPLPLLILFAHLLLLSCHAVLPQEIRQHETLEFHDVASDILIL